MTDISPTLRWHDRYAIEDRGGDRRGFRDRPGRRPRTAAHRLVGGAGGPARRDAPGDGGARGRGALARRAHRRLPARGGGGAVHGDRGPLRPGGPAVQQRGHVRAGRGPGRGPALRRLAARGGHQPQRGVPVRADGVPDDEGAGSARRPDHQQRLDLGAHAPPPLGRLHRDQARADRPHQVPFPGRASVPDRGRADRHRQRGHRHDAADAVRRAPGERGDGARADDGRGRCGAHRTAHGGAAAGGEHAVRDGAGDGDAVHRARLTIRPDGM
ncbi:Oxidoreductase, short chain dehydrogenase/reductase family [Streptomyces misionensis JCM 4497]